MDSPRDSHLPTADWYSIDGWGSRSRKGIRLRPRRSGTAPGACAWSVILAPLQQISNGESGLGALLQFTRLPTALVLRSEAVWKMSTVWILLYSSSSGTGAHDL